MPEGPSPPFTYLTLHDILEVYAELFDCTLLQAKRICLEIMPVSKAALAGCITGHIALLSYRVAAYSLTTAMALISSFSRGSVAMRTTSTVVLVGR